MSYFFGDLFCWSWDSFWPFKVTQQEEQELKFLVGVKEQANANATNEEKRETRRQLMDAKFKEVFMTPKFDSLLAKNYVDRGLGDPDHIIDKYLEMDWFVKNTQYNKTKGQLQRYKYEKIRQSMPKSKRRVKQAINKVIVEKAKNKVLRQMIADGTIMDTFLPPLVQCRVNKLREQQ